MRAAAAIWRWSSVVVAGHAHHRGHGLRLTLPALHYTMAKNVSGLLFARLRPLGKELVTALAAAGTRSVTKIISLFVEQHSSGCSSCMRAREGAGTGRVGIFGSDWDRMPDGVQAGAMSTRPADRCPWKDTRMPARWAVAQNTGCTMQ